MSAQPSISPLKQHSNKHSPKSTEKTKASPNKKIQITELSSTLQPITSKTQQYSCICRIAPIRQENKEQTSISNPIFLQQLEQKVNQYSDEGKHTPKQSSKTQQLSEKNGVKKAQAQKNGACNSKSQQQAQNQPVNGSSNGVQQVGSSKQKSCFNSLCPKDKNNSFLPSPQQESTKKQNANIQYKQVKLEKTNEKATFCDICCQRYQEKHFCYYCQQVYFDDYNIDDKEWISCDTCDRWCHLHCEDDKVKKAFANSQQSDNVQYDCPRCRNKENSSSSSTTQPIHSNQTQSKSAQASSKTSKEKPQSVSTANIKQKKNTKNKDKEEKKQDQVDQQIENLMKGQINGQNIPIPQLNSYHQHSTQQSSVTQNSTRKLNLGPNSTSRDQIQANTQNDQDIIYTLDNFKRKKNKIFQNKSIAQLYQPIQPIVFPNYTTIEDLLKSAGISVSLDENSIKSDLNDMKRMLMESSDSSFKSNSSSQQLPNGIHNIQNGQSYSIVVNQE